MKAIEWIIEYFNWFYDYFHGVYLEIYDWPWPFWMIADLFLYMAWASNKIAWAFYDFHGWVVEVSSKIPFIMTLSEMLGWIGTYWPSLDEIHRWYWDRVNKITGVITSWWSATSLIVIGWIDVVYDFIVGWINYLQSQINELTVRLDNLVIEIPDLTPLFTFLSNWRNNVLSVVENWWTDKLLNISNLINSAFVIRESFWAGWQDWRDKVAEFFTDPEDWLYKSLDRIVERFW